MRLRTLSIVIGLVLVTGRGFCYPGDVSPLCNREYFPAAQRGISQAKKSILLVMYLISFNKEDKNSKVFQLMDELIKAKLRGVEVKVILDYQSGSSFSAGQSNYEAFRFLKDKGIDAYFDGAGVYTHNKAIVIDKRIVISGSHNWSNAALARSNETSFLIDSPKLARQLLDEFSRIKLSGQELKEDSGVGIPYWAMEKNGIIPEMFRRYNERGFDIWLLLLRDFDGNAEGAVNTNYEVLAESLGWLKHMDRRAYRGEINRQLRGLSKLYKLVEIDTKYNQPIKVRLLKKVERESFSIPRAYWDYAWANRLNMDAKVCLLINLAELGRKQQPPEWMLTRPQITEKYGINRNSLYLGMKALRDFNIIDVKCSQIDVGYENRMPSATVFLGLYDMREFEQNLARLEEAYGRELIIKSREYAFVVFKGYDLGVIEEIAKLININGAANVDEAFRIVEQKSPDNPKRIFGYVIGILDKMKAAVIPAKTGT
ncbi:MAG: phospholipase D-like domain-containing protein [Candidatus Omnitrophica bacterium]|nr:phospholipase D-like domain-containing protein [Candidatus Omnitrophota bacterium]